MSELLKVEESMVDIAYDLLKNNEEPMNFSQLMNQVAKRKQFSKKLADNMMPQLYTEINIDGRFTCVGKSTWGLKDWYSLEQSSDSAVAANVKDDYLDEEGIEEDFEDEEEFEDDAHPLNDGEEEKD